MNVAIGPFAIATTLLVVGGVAKALRPDDTAHALRTAGVPITAVLVRVGGAIEVGLGLWALLSATRVPAVLVAASYLGFLVFVAFAMARGLPIASCGCFGRLDTPPSRIHLVLNAAAVAAAAAVALDPGDGLRRVVEDQPLAGIPYLALLATGVAGAVVALSALPRALARSDGAPE